MKREVTLYTIEERTVLAYDKVSFFRQHKPLDLGQYTAAGDTMLYTAEVGRIDVPVRKYVEEVMDDRFYVNRVERFVAIDPELERLISSALWDNIADLKDVIKQREESIDQLNTRIDTYNALPWYKKLFRMV